MSENEHSTPVIDLDAFRRDGVLRAPHAPMSSAVRGPSMPCPVCGVGESTSGQIAWALRLIGLEARGLDNPALKSFERYREHRRYEVHRLAVILEGYCYDHMWPELLRRRDKARRERMAQRALARRAAQKRLLRSANA